jgi:hypothetical protein
VKSYLYCAVFLRCICDTPCEVATDPLVTCDWILDAAKRRDSCFLLLLRYLVYRLGPYERVVTLVCHPFDVTTLFLVRHEFSLKVVYSRGLWTTGTGWTVRRYSGQKCLAFPAQGC